METETASCSILDRCERVVPLWLILLDNIPTATMYLLGAALAWLLWKPLAVLLMLYNLLAIVLFWQRICRYCPHFGTRACICGYGVLAARYFKKAEGGAFRKIFRKNIAVMYPCWFVPFAAGLYLLYAHFSLSLLVLFLTFALVAFVLIPFISRFVGCKGCTIKDQCPWMTSEAASPAPPS